MAMSGSGLRIPGTRIMAAHRATARPGPRAEGRTFAYCEAAVSDTPLKTCNRGSGAGMHGAGATSTAESEWRDPCRRALHNRAAKSQTSELALRSWPLQRACAAGGPVDAVAPH